MVVLPAETVRQVPGLLQRREELHVEQLVSEPGVEGLDVSILPGAAWLDEEGGAANFREPGSELTGDEFRPVVGAQVLGCAAVLDDLGELLDHVLRRDAARGMQAS